MPVSATSQGHFADNILYFARTLRAAGLPIGPGKVLDALEAVETAGLRRRDDFYWTLHAVFVNRQDQQELFDQTFHIFWRNPEILERMISMMLPALEADPGQREEEQKALKRVSEALMGTRKSQREEEQEIEEHELEATLTWSSNEILRKKDFEDMSSAEIAEAKRLLAQLSLPIEVVPTRRFGPKSHGRRIDMRRTLRSSLRAGGGIIELERKARIRRTPPLVVLCDISGSMSIYSRMLLHFLHAVTNDRDRVHTFLFGTRLTNVTRHLRHKDIDIALARIGDTVLDWEGGTRIGATLLEFNRRWARRVLGQGAVVLLISDGLDRDAGAGLAHQMERLHMSCRRLVWLNPLLRFEGFQPKSRGVRAMLPHVDEFRPAHNLNSLTDLASALGESGARRMEGGRQFREALET